MAKMCSPTYCPMTTAMKCCGPLVAFLVPGETSFRISRTGAVHLVRWKRNTRWKLPLAEDVFFAWLRDKGFEAELSTCGRLAKQMHAQLGGWLNVLANEPLLKLMQWLEAARTEKARRWVR